MLIRNTLLRFSLNFPVTNKQLKKRERRGINNDSRFRLVAAITGVCFNTRDPAEFYLISFDIFIQMPERISGFYP